MTLSIVYNTDCLQGLYKTPEKSFDLAIIDPPYGIGEDGGKNHTRGNKGIPATNYKPFQGGDIAPDIEFFNELFRVSRFQIIFGANHFISKIPYDSACWIVWDKNRPNQDFADGELAWTNFDRSLKIFHYTWDGFRQENMKHKEKRIHPTQKPVDLYAWILRTFAKKGWKILDTHVGSGSSRVACYDMGFDFMGYEIDDYYWLAQENRFKEHKKQMRLL